MDALTQAFLILAANTLITYFLLKQQDARLAKKAYQDQVKFSDTYAKRVKTLETLIEKFSSFENALSDLARRTIRVITSEGQYKEQDLEAENNDISEKLEGLKRFYKSNRHFLSDPANEVIREIVVDLDEIRRVISLIGSEHVMGTVPEGILEFLPDSVDPEVFKKLSVVDPGYLLARLIVELEAYSKRLEILYKLESNS